jgi:hypothetical protein
LLPGQIRLTVELERDLQTNLNFTRVARADDRVSGDDVRCAERAAEDRSGGWVIVAAAGAIRRSLRVFRDRVVEHVEHFKAELRGIAFLEREVFEHGKIQVFEA